jgi:hypothetical protein
MSRHPYTQSPQSHAALTTEEAERVRTALRSAAGEYAQALELTAEELEERIAPGLNSTN